MIAVTAVRKKFGEVLALDGVTLSIGPAERVAFVGANGSGKTTLLRALLGIVRFEGTITIDTIDVAESPHLAFGRMAYIPQIAPPIEASVAELVRAHATLRGRSDSGTYERARRLGLDVDTSRGKRFRDLSGGMKQKLLAAMALATEAPILVCDEPTANLDGEARNAFFAQLSERPKNSVAVLCSHRIEEVQKLVDRVIAFEGGRVVRDGDTGHILRELKAFRVEIADRQQDTSRSGDFKRLGFLPISPGRYAIDVSQEEKMVLIAELMDKYRDKLADISVVPLDDISRAAPRSQQEPLVGDT